MGLRALRFIAVALQQREVRAARFTHEGVPEARLALPVGLADDVELVLRRLRSTILQVWPHDSDVAGIGVSVPGLFDYRRGLIVHTLPENGWRDVPLRNFLTTAFDLPVFVGSETDLAALAEYRFGAGQGVGDLVYLHVGQRIGGGLLIGGRLFTGGNGVGGQMGHLTVEADGPRCPCGSRGCLDLYASSSALVRQAQEALRAGRTSRLAAMVEGRPDRLDAATIIAAARAGDPLSLHLLAQMGHYLGVAVVDLMYLFNPRRFVFGGLAVQAGDLLLRPLRETVIERAPAIYREGVLLQRAALEEEVGLWGALAYLLTELGIKPGA